MAQAARVQKLTYYLVEGECEKNEGRGGRYTVGHFSDEEMAKLSAAGHGVQGFDGNIRAITGDVVIYNDIETNVKVVRALGESINLQTVDLKEIRAAALRKLSDVERKVLGLK